MTRGFVVLMKNGKIFKVVYSGSDSYPSNLGIFLLEAFEKDNIEKIFMNINSIDDEDLSLEADNEDAICSLYGDDSRRFNSYKIRKEFLIKNKSNINEYFLDYTYMYDINKKILKVYSYGELLYSIRKEDIQLYKFLFNNNELFYSICYNSKTASLDKDFNKEIKKVMRKNPSIEDLKNIHHKEPKIFISTGKIGDVWDNSYKKLVKDKKSYIATFIIMESFGKYELLIQLPFIRNCIFKGTSSPKSCEKKLIEIVKSNTDKLINFKKACYLYQKYEKNIKELDLTLSYEELEDRANNLIKDFKTKLLEIGEYLTTSSFNNESLVYEINTIKNIHLSKK